MMDHLLVSGMNLFDLITEKNVQKLYLGVRTFVENCVRTALINAVIFVRGRCQVCKPAARWLIILGRDAVIVLRRHIQVGVLGLLLGLCLRLLMGLFDVNLLMSQDKYFKYFAFFFFQI